MAVIYLLKAMLELSKCELEYDQQMHVGPASLTAFRSWTRLTRYDVFPEYANECVTIGPRVLVPEAQSMQ